MLPRQHSLHTQTFIALSHKIQSKPTRCRSKPTRCNPNTFSCKTSRRFTLYFSNFVYRPSFLLGRQQRRDIPENAHGTTRFSFFSTLKRNVQKNSITVSSRSPGCSTAIESLIPTLTARVLQLCAAVPTRAGVFTMVMRKICNYWPMNKNYFGRGLISIALEELIMVPPVYLLEKC